MDSLVSARTWRDGVAVEHTITRNDLVTAAHDPDTLVWVDLLAPEASELAEVSEELGLPVTAVEDALAPKERPKLIRHESHVFFTVYAVHREGTRLGFSRVSGWMLPHALVTIRLDDTFDIGAVEQRWDDSPALLAAGAGGLVHGLLDTVVDGHFAAIQTLDDALEAIEDTLFDDRPTSTAFARSVYALRKDLVALRRIVLPMREVVSGLLRHPGTDAPVLRPWYDDLYDHVLRASEWTESLRDLVTSAFETNLSLTDARLNTIMKKLAGWAAIIAVPTAITGWFGQNIPFPGDGQPLGLWLSAALILVCSLALYVAFRRRDWL
ncbi:magnesium transporter CorA family protein [Propioniciclava soli]|uniref:magnesium transporter CorA family protein n=1 Tax=Propioniciclava soli TaxID=2775081 RepID=UPI001E38883D|nr:magnesium transporter CorA family protein [Propioniciclava soli]